MPAHAEGRRRTGRAAGASRFADRAGFTLLEVLVALTVMATLMGVLYRSVVVTRTGALTFADRAGQVAVARGLLAEFVARRDLRDGDYRGERDGRSWTLSARPLDLSHQLPTAPPPSAAQGQAALVAAGALRSDDGAPRWAPQRLVLRVGTAPRVLELEAVRLARPPLRAAASAR